MVARPYVFMHKNEFKDYSVLFLNQIRSARKTIAEFVIYCSFSDSCVQLSGKEKEATMSVTIQKILREKENSIMEISKESLENLLERTGLNGITEVLLPTYGKWRGAIKSK